MQLNLIKCIKDITLLITLISELEVKVLTTPMTSPPNDTAKEGAFVISPPLPAVKLINLLCCEFKAIYIYHKYLNFSSIFWILLMVIKEFIVKTPTTEEAEVDLQSVHGCMLSTIKKKIKIF